MNSIITPCTTYTIPDQCDTWQMVFCESQLGNMSRSRKILVGTYMNASELILSVDLQHKCSSKWPCFHQRPHGLPNDVGHTLDLCPVGSSGVQWGPVGRSKIWTSRSFSIFLNLSCCVASPNGCTAKKTCLLKHTLWASLRPIETSP